MDGGIGLEQDVLRRTPREVIELLERMAARIDELEKEVAKLGEQARQNSSNSSFPSSSDRPDQKRKRKPPQKPSGRRRGGQPGRTRRTRPLVPPEQVDETVDCKPDHCRKCGETLDGEDPDPKRHQVTDIPPIEPHVIEYRMHRVDCAGCGTSNRGRLPDGVPTGWFGPRLCALVALLVSMRLGKRPIRQLLADLFSLDISLGMISKIERQTARILRHPFKELLGFVRTQPVNIDETSWRVGKKKAWLWVVVSESVAVFKIARRRTKQVAIRLLGKFYEQVATSDRHGAYNWITLRQLCWAHLLRDFQAMIDRNDAGAKIGKKLLEHGVVMLGWWRDVREGKCTRGTFRKHLRHLKIVFRQDLEAGLVCGAAKTQRVCAKLLKDWDHLWTFAAADGVEPTNNTGERTIKIAVLYRKSSGGTDSRRGNRFIERLFSIVATCRRQDRNVFDYLTACWNAFLSRETIPSLLPKEAHSKTSMPKQTPQAA